MKERKNNNKKQVKQLKKFMLVFAAAMLAAGSLPATAAPAQAAGKTSVTKSASSSSAKSKSKWVKSGKRWWYRRGNGSYPHSEWEKINKKWYHFDASGWMQTGWKKIGGKWYYMKKSGAMTTGWQKVGGKWYYMNKSGVMQTGWEKVGGKWYYMDKNGVMQTGWQKVGGEWYYMNENGAMATGWINVDGKWYYLDNSGKMQTNASNITVTLSTEGTASTADSAGTTGTAGNTGNVGAPGSLSASAAQSSPSVEENGNKVDIGESSTPAESGQDKNTVKATSYSYTIQPILAPFNNAFYVKTDNPDPSDIRFVDKQSVYATSGKTAYISPSTKRYLDVRYENTATGKVNGGYIFLYHDSYIDGGTLSLQVKSGGSFVDTGVTVECPAVKNNVQYLIDTYTTPGMSFFEKLDAVQTGLKNVAVYPWSVFDTSKKYDLTPYPSLATSVYPEMALNDHVSMYELADQGLFLNYVYPYILDSLGFPSMMGKVATALDPSCTVENGSYHSQVKISKGGTTKVYGGAGKGESNPFYSNHAEKNFLFNYTSGDLGTNATLSSLRSQRDAYSKCAAEDAEKYYDILCGTTFAQKVGPSNWIRVTQEDYVYGQTKQYAFVTCGGNYSGPSNIESVENVWVDGRYVNVYNYWEEGAKFSDYPTAKILIRNMTYKSYGGSTKTGDVTFYYDSAEGDWKAREYYGYINKGAAYPEEMVLTQDEVKKMQMDKNTNVAPEKGLIYDGSAEPGTIFKN